MSQATSVHADAASKTHAGSSLSLRVAAARSLSARWWGDAVLGSGATAAESKALLRAETRPPRRPSLGSESRGRASAVDEAGDAGDASHASDARRSTRAMRAMRDAGDAGDAGAGASALATKGHFQKKG